MFTEGADMVMQTQMFECFSGQGHVSAVFKRAGVSTVSFDRELHPGKRTMDFLSEGGFASKPHFWFDTLIILNAWSMLSRPGLEVVPSLCDATVPGSFQLSGARLRIMEFGFEGHIPTNSYEPCWKGSPEICLLWKWYHIKPSLTQFSMLYNFDGVARWSQTPLTHVPAGWFAYCFLWWRSTPFGYWNSPVGQNRFYHGMPDLNGFATTSCMFFNCNFKGLYRMRILKQWISMVFH